MNNRKLEKLVGNRVSESARVKTLPYVRKLILSIDKVTDQVLATAKQCSLQTDQKELADFRRKLLKARNHLASKYALLTDKV